MLYRLQVPAINPAKELANAINIYLPEMIGFISFGAGPNLQVGFRKVTVLDGEVLP